MVNKKKKNEQVTIEQSREAQGLPPIERDEQGRDINRAPAGSGGGGEGTGVVTQDVLDKALDKGINVFGGRNLSKLSTGEQLQQERINQNQTAIEGSKDLQNRLREQILNPPSLEPGSLTDLATDLNRRAGNAFFNIEGKSNFINGLLSGEISNDQIKEFAKGELKAGLVRGGVVAAAAGALFGIPAVAQLATRIAVGSSVGGLSTAITSASGAILGSIIGAGGISGATIDINRSRIDNLASSLDSIPGQSSTTQSAVQTGGLTPEEGILNLRQLADAVDIAERDLKNASLYNLRFRYSDEYKKLEQKIHDARTNLIERTGGIRNVALTGQTTFDPQRLAFDISTLK